MLEALADASPPEQVQHAVLVQNRYPPTKWKSEARRVGVPFMLDDGVSHVQLLIRALLAFPRTFLKVRKLAPDVLHSHTRGGMLMGRLLHLATGIPLVFTHHTYGKNKSRYRWKADSSRVANVYLTRHMLDYYRAEQDVNARVISECVPDNLKGGESDRIQEAGPVTFVGMGTYTPRKRWHLIPEAVSRLPENIQANVRVDLYGDATDAAYHSRLTSEIRRHHLENRIRVHARTHHPMEKLAQADWFLFPSVMEPCSVALIESLAVGLPALAADSGGTTEIVRPPEGGHLFQADNAADLARHLGDVVAGNLPRPDTGTVQSAVSHRKASHVYKKYLELYRCMCTVHPGSEPKR